MSLQAARVVEYGVSEFGYAISVTYSNNSVEEFTYGNSPWDSTTILDPKNGNSVDKETLMLYCLRSIEDLKLSGIVISENPDMAPYYEFC